MAERAPRDLWRLTVRDDFAASHCLRNYGGKCEALHGHNFGVAVTVEGETLDADVEILVDFAVLKGALKEVLGELDHHHLNEVAPFDVQNPSSENMARHVFLRMEEKLAGLPVRVLQATVSEKPAQSATYCRAPGAPFVDPDA
ncbi:MAG: 6-carboxytetrahydropterin synthase QueD [Desulfovibrionaceae bacterium]|jgi:6-pyruvoyltetrahydropterin/6-carboxytetrahydropterin synthase|nr:6-carboxytetrahydropterin synthase QueD [Desulfovibrionaceae bacterium]